MKIKKFAALIAVLLSLALIMMMFTPVNVFAAGATMFSRHCVRLIQTFEGCRLTAYKPLSTETYYTIGWGHYGPDVKKGMTITQAQADNMLLDDLNNDYLPPVLNFAKKYKRTLTQNELDALVSFTYNMGDGWMYNSGYDIFKYMSTGKYTADQISESMTSWSKASGITLEGLYLRRQAEVAILLLPQGTPYEVFDVTASNLNMRKEASVESDIIMSVSNNTKLVVDQRVTIDGNIWGKTRYFDGKVSQVGWCALKYDGSLNAKCLFGSQTKEPILATTTEPTTAPKTTTAAKTTTQPETTSEYISTAAATTTPTVATTAAKTTVKPTVATTAAKTTIAKTTAAKTTVKPTVPKTTAKPTTPKTTAAKTTAKPTIPKTTVKPTTPKTTAAKTTAAKTTAAPTTLDPAYVYPFISIAGMGDVNGDGSVNAKDTLMLRKVVAKIKIPVIMPGEAVPEGAYAIFKNSDIDGTGKLNSKDILMLRKHLAKIVVRYLAEG